MYVSISYVYVFMCLSVYVCMYFICLWFYESLPQKMWDLAISTGSPYRRFGWRTICLWQICRLNVNLWLQAVSKTMDDDFHICISDPRLMVICLRIVSTFIWYAISEIPIFLSTVSHTGTICQIVPASSQELYQFRWLLPLPSRVLWCQNA